MNACPVCGSRRIVRSRTRVGLESVRRKLTSKRPYRCFNCKWRGWIDDATEAPASADETGVPVELLADDTAAGHHSPHRH